MIRVNDDWVIKEDALNYMPCRDLHRMTLDKRRNPPAEVPEYAVPLGYYQTLEGALRAIVRDEIRRAGVFDEELSLEAYIGRIRAMDEQWRAFFREMLPDAGRWTK